MAQGHLQVDTFGFHVDTDDFEAASAVFAVVQGRCLVAAGEWRVGIGELSAVVAHVEPGAGGFEVGRIDPGVAFSTRCVRFVDSEAGDWMKVRPHLSPFPQGEGAR